MEPQAVVILPLSQHQKSMCEAYQTYIIDCARREAKILKYLRKYQPDEANAIERHASRLSTLEDVSKDFGLYSDHLRGLPQNEIWKHCHNATAASAKVWNVDITLENEHHSSVTSFEDEADHTTMMENLERESAIESFDVEHSALSEEDHETRQTHNGEHMKVSRNSKRMLKVDSSDHRTNKRSRTEVAAVATEMKAGTVYCNGCGQAVHGDDITCPMCDAKCHRRCANCVEFANTNQFCGYHTITNS